MTDPRDREREKVNKIIAGVCNARRNSDLRADDADVIEAFTEAFSTARREGEAESHALLLTSARELLALLRDKWACPDADAMTLYLGAILAGIAEEWNKNPPENGFTHAVEFPGIGKLQIDIHKIEGKSAAQSLRELESEHEAILSLLPDDATCKHPETGESLLDNLRDALKRLEDAERKARALDWYDKHNGAEPMKVWHLNKWCWRYMGQHYDTLLEAIESAAKEPK